MIHGINLDSNNNLDKHCEVRQQANQTRDKFCLSNDKAIDIFELIHSDL